MSIWIGNIVLMLFYSIFLNKRYILIRGKKTSLIVILMSLQLLFLYTFNDYNIFPDTLAYLNLFDHVSKTGWLDIPQIRNHIYIKPDFGFIYFVKTLSFLFNNRTILLFVTGFVYIKSYFTIINRYSLIPWLAILLFISTVFYDSLFILRQSLSVSVCLFSIPYIIERKLFKFLLLILIAFSIHQTSFIFIILYLIFPYKISMKFFFYSSILGIVAFLGLRFVIDFVIPYLSGYSIYLEDVFELSNATSAIISLIVFLFILICYYPFNNISQYDRLFFHMLLIYLIIDLSRFGLPGSIGRLNLYFTIGLVILLPNAIKRIKQPVFKYISVIAISISYFILMINHMNYGFDLINFYY